VDQRSQDACFDQYLCLCRCSSLIVVWTSERVSLVGTPILVQKRPILNIDRTLVGLTAIFVTTQAVSYY
jgi:hypothetical protein